MRTSEKLFFLNQGTKTIRYPSKDKIQYRTFITYLTAVRYVYLQFLLIYNPRDYLFLLFFIGLFLDDCLFGQEIYSNIPGDVSISSHNTFQDSKDIWSSAPSDAKVT
jgi:hypothetical protein